MAFASVEHDGGTISSNHQTEAELRAELGAALKPEAAADSDAAADTPAATTAEPPKVDRRTREGRIASVQAQIDEFTAKRETAKREAEAEEARVTKLRAEARELETRRVTPQPAHPTNGNGNGHQPQAPKADDDPEPKYEDFVAKVGADGDAYTPWLEAKTRWAARDEFRKQQAAHAEREHLTAHEREVDQKLTTLMDRISKSVNLEPAKGREIYDALVSKGVRADIFLNPDIRPLSALRPGEKGDYRHALADVVLHSDRPVEMMIELSKDATVQRLAALPPDAFYRAIGGIDQSLVVASNGPIAKPVKLSAASPPTKPLGSSPVAATPEPPGEDATEAEYEAYWGPRRKQVRRGR